MSTVATAAPAAAILRTRRTTARAAASSSSAMVPSSETGADAAPSSSAASRSSASRARKTAPTTTTTAPSASTKTTAAKHRTAAGASAGVPKATAASAPVPKSKTPASRPTATVRSAVATTSGRTRAAPESTSRTGAAKAGAAAVRSAVGRAAKETSAEPPSPMSEEQILAQLADAAICSPRLIPSIAGYLGISSEDLGIAAEPASSAIKPLSAARASYFAKQIVNAVLGSTNSLIESGWKVTTPAEDGKTTSSKGTTSAPRTVAHSAASGRARAAAPTTTKTTSATQRQGPCVASVRALIDAFRVAARFLLRESRSPRSASAKGKELEVETVILRYIGKLTSFGLHDIAAEEVVYLHRCAVENDSPTGCAATASAAELDAAILLPIQGTASRSRSFFVELQSQAFHCRLEAAKEVDDMDSASKLLSHPDGPLAWQEKERASDDTNIKVVDRAAYLIERSVARFLQRLGGQTGGQSVALRCVALRMLLMMSDLEASAFWDRVARTGTSCVRTELANGGDASQAFEAVQDMYEALIEAARQRSSDFVGGEAYATFCESWIALAKKIGKADSIDRATQALTGVQPRDQTSPPTEQADEPVKEQGEPITLSEDDLIRLCGKLTKAVIALDQALKDQETSSIAADALAEALTALGSVRRWPCDLRRASQVKVFRCLDQVRRRCLLVADKSGASKASTRPGTPDHGRSTSNDDSRSALLDPAIQLLDSTLELQSDAFRLARGQAKGDSSPGQKEHMPPAVEQLNQLVYSFRFLANARFASAVRPRQDECFAYLSRCTELVQCDAAAELLAPDVRSQNLYLLSSSYYNIGGRLYSDRQYDAAVRFLEPACRLGAESGRLFANWKSDRMDEDGAHGDSASSVEVSEDEARKRQAAMPKKWEHLAVSYRLGSSKAKAVEAYREAIFSLPDASYRKLEEQASKMGASSIFRDPAWTTLASLLKAAIELCVFDLFKSQEGSASDGSISAWMSSFAAFPNAAALMLEHCVAVLEPRLHHDEALAASLHLLDAAATIYDQQQTPIRAARIMMRRAEIELFSGAQCTPLDAIEKVLEESQARLSAGDLAGDTGLSRFLPQYRATAVLLQVEVDQRRASSSTCARIVAGVQEACKHLTPLVAAASSTAAQSSPASTRPGSKPSPGLARSPSTKQAASRTVHMRPTPATRVLKPRNAPPQTKAAAPPVTPPSRSAKLATHAKSSRTSISPASAAAAHAQGSQAATGVLDNAERFCAHLEHVYESLATYGHTPSSIELAKVLRRLSQSSVPGPVGKDIYLRVSASLAKQYLHLGKLPRAGTVLNQALGFFHRTDAGRDISNDTKFRCLMASAEYTCRQGQHEKSVQRFEEAVELVRRDAAKGSSLQVALEKCRAMERRAMAAEVHSTILCSHGDLAGAVQSAVQAVRFGARMTTLLSRLTAPAPSSSRDQERRNRDIFSAPTSDLHQSDAVTPPVEGEAPQPERKQPRLSSFTVAAMHWRLSRLLVQAYLRVSQLYSIRGSGSDAEAFAGDGIELADATASSLTLSRALIQRGEIRLQLGQIASGQDDLSRSFALLQENWIPEAIVLTCIQGDSLARIEQLPEALKSYAAGEATLRQLNAAFTELDAILPSPRPAAAAAARRSSPNTGRRRSGSTCADALLPEVQARLLRRQGWILQLLGRTDESEDLFEKALAIQGEGSAAGVDARFDQHLVQGRVSLRRALQQLKSDRLLSMLPDAAISMPMMPSSTSSKALSVGSGANAASAAAMKSAMGLLLSADSAFSDALVQGGASSHALAVREAFVSLAQVQTMQGTLSKGSKGAAEGAAALVDSALSVNIRRDLVHAINHKLKDRSGMDDLNAWPTFKPEDDEEDEDDAASVCDSDDETAVLGKKMSKLGLSSEPDPIKTQITTSSSLSDYWKLVKGRHLASQSATAPARPDLLPRNWTVISLTYLKDRETLLLTRQTGGGGDDGCQANEPTIYSLPLDRQSNRDMEEHELTMQAAQERLEQIVRSSNDGIHGAKDVEGMEARKRWWSARRALDKELEDLLAEMQNTWLGAFKGVLAEPVRDDPALASLRSRFDKIVKRACFPPTTANKKTPRLKLDDAVFECFAGIPADCSDEDFEDLLHYVMDALQFSGLQVAVDEVDLDEVAIDLRNALEEFRGKQAKAAQAPSLNGPGGIFGDDVAMGSHGGGSGAESDHHLFLVLDKDTAVFPWESMPILRRRAVSRIPSMAFLQDRIDLARVYHHLPGESDGRRLTAGRRSKSAADAKARKGGSSRDRRGADEEESWKVALRNGRLFNLSKRRTSYLLNPGGDLVRTQERFEPWLRSRAASGWSGVVGREPILEELPRLLSSSDLMLYFGHAGAEQYIRRSKVRELERCAVTMLFGCSSAMLRDHGDFDRTGTPFNYMCAGSPAMVGNLWDTTDRELDSVCEGILTKLGLMDEADREANSAASGKPASTTTAAAAAAAKRTEASRMPKEMSIVRAVAESRDECKLSFLTGAACVVYGVPVYWAHDDE